MCSCTASGYFSLNDFEKILVEGELDDSKGDDLGERVAFLLILTTTFTDRSFMCLLVIIIFDHAN